jgi:hypothetical protein
MFPTSQEHPENIIINQIVLVKFEKLATALGADRHASFPHRLA